MFKLYIAKLNKCILFTFIDCCSVVLKFKCLYIQHLLISQKPLVSGPSLASIFEGNKKIKANIEYSETKKCRNYILSNVVS